MHAAAEGGHIFRGVPSLLDKAVVSCLVDNTNSYQDAYSQRKEAILEHLCEVKMSQKQQTELFPWGAEKGGNSFHFSLPSEHHPFTSTAYISAAVKLQYVWKQNRNRRTAAAAATAAAGGGDTGAAFAGGGAAAPPLGLEAHTLFDTKG